MFSNEKPVYRNSLTCKSCTYKPKTTVNSKFRKIKNYFILHIFIKFLNDVVNPLLFLRDNVAQLPNVFTGTFCKPKDLPITVTE
jgi:hypothetical protein